MTKSTTIVIEVSCFLSQRKCISLESTTLRFCRFLTNYRCLLTVVCSHCLRMTNLLTNDIQTNPLPMNNKIATINCSLDWRPKEKSIRRKLLFDNKRSDQTIQWCMENNRDLFQHWQLQLIWCEGKNTTDIIQKWKGWIESANIVVHVLIFMWNTHVCIIYDPICSNKKQQTVQHVQTNKHRHLSARVQL